MADPTGTLEPRPGDSNNMLLQKILLNLADLPGAFIPVSGGSMTGPLGIVDGTSTAPGLFFTGQPTTGLYRPGTGKIAFLSNGVVAGTIEADSGTGGMLFAALGANENVSFVPSGTGKFIVYGTTVAGGVNLSRASWGVAGVQLQTGSGRIFTDTSAAGTVATAVANSFYVPTFNATNARTITDAANLYIAGDVAVGTNVTLTNSYGLWNVGKTRLDGVTRITSTTASSTATTGALVVSGGGAFGGNVNVGGYIKASTTGLSGNFQASVNALPVFSATATGFNAAYYAGCSTEDTVVTYPKVVGVYVDDASKGAASTITEQIGVYIKAQTKGAAKYGIYQAGTESNYFGGSIAIGNTVAAGVGVASTHKVTISIGGNTYYLLASNV